MNIRLAMRDSEYAKALADVICKAQKDVYVEIRRSFEREPGMIMVTDISVEKIKKYSSVPEEIVFLVEDPSAVSVESSELPFRLFKYMGVDRIVAELRLCYYILTGVAAKTNDGCKFIGICSDGNEVIAAGFAGVLARQIRYMTGGNVLILPFTYLDPFGDGSNADNGVFKRMMYYIYAGRELPKEVFFIKDRYDVSRIRLPTGKSPLVDMDNDAAMLMIERLGRLFDTIIIYTGAVLSSNNIKLLDMTDEKLFLHSLKNEESCKNITEKARYIDLFSNDRDMEVIADDEVKRIWSA